MFDSLELSAILISIIAGILLGIPSGPARFFVIDTCIKESKKAALKVYGGLLVSKLLYAGLALLANDFISSHKKVEAIVYLVAAFLLMVWGVVIVVQSRKKVDTSIEINTSSQFKKGFIVGISNPIIPFIYLTYFQFLKIYADEMYLLKYIWNIFIFEVASFVVLALIAMMLLSVGKKVLNHWNKITLVMGIFLFCAGAQQVYQHVEYKNGFKIINEKNVLEKQLEEVEARKGGRKPASKPATAN